jgi:DNA-binding LacI/PurR family transcriptional regulator
MKRAEIREILKRHKAIAQLARELGVSRVTVGLVLRGRTTSARILDAARKRACELLEREEKRAA